MSIYKMRTDLGHYFKWLLLLIVVPIFVIGGVTYFGPGMSGGKREAPGAKDVIATVNGLTITRQDFENAWERTVEEAKSRGVRSPLQYSDLRANEFQRLVNDITLLQAAEQMGVDVSDKKVESEIDKAITGYLKQSRQAALGKLSKEEEAKDPRDDVDYKNALASVGRSIATEEQFAKSRIPENQVRAQLAQQGIMSKLRSTVKPVTDADITASYNVYKIRQIALPTAGAPKEQMITRANKIVAEAKAGTDFAKLARENAPGGGNSMDVTFENSFYFPPEVKNAIEKTKAGQVAPVIQTGDAIYIVKVEGVTSKVPANLDKKAKDKRRDQISQMREMGAAMKFQQEMVKSQKVEVKDPELLGYWNLFKAQRAYGNPAEQQKFIKMATGALERARKQRPDNSIATSKLVQLYNDQGKYEEAIRLLYPMVAGDNATVEGADLRMLLGDMLLKKGEKDRAIAQYKEASEVAMNDIQVHQQLVTKFQQLKQPDLVAAENKWIADYQQRQKEMDALKKKRAPGSPKE